MRDAAARLGRIRAPYVAAAFVVVVGVAVTLAFVLGGGSASTSTPRPTGAARVRHVAEPAGPNPSESAQMVCSPEAQNDLASALGVASTAVTQPTWVDHVYACRYVYTDGTMALSVKELSSNAETTAYFNSLAAQLGVSRRLPGVAQGAFVTGNGSLVLRKDYKVLYVDTSGLPEPFGSGFRTRDQAAVGVGVTLLGCWTGA
jgi:hypothetical protein